MSSQETWELWDDTVFPDPDFPLSVQFITQEDFPSHRHTFTELVIVVEGSGIHTLGGTPYPIERGDTFVIPSTISHGYRETRYLRIANVLFHRRILSGVEEELTSLPGYLALFRLEPRSRLERINGARLRLSEAHLAESRSLAANLRDELASRPLGFRLMSVSLLTGLVVLACRGVADSETSKNEPLLGIARSMTRIRSRYTEELRLDDLATEAGMSVRSYIRHFRWTAGIPPIRYLTEVRIEIGRRLLEETSLNVTEIAGRVGFSDGSYFARQFRNHTGMSPLQYRRDGRR
jgi:AraC-like DNA-binding protein